MKKVFVILALIQPAAAHAYLGLGPVLPFIGAAVVLLFAIILAIFGVFLKPILKRFSKEEADNEGDVKSDSD